MATPCGAFSSLSSTALADTLDIDEAGPSFVPRVLRINNEASLKSRGGIVSVAAASRCLYVACLNGDLIRWYPDENEGALIDFQSPRPTEKREIRRIFLNDKGLHCLVAMANGDNYYVHFGSDQAKFMSRLKDRFIESVAWNKLATEASTRDIIIGTRHGALVECLIDGEKDRHVRPLFEFPGKKTPILDVRLENCPLPGGGQGQLLLVATPKQLYLFAGTPHLAATFQTFNNPSDWKHCFAFEVPRESPPQGGGAVLQLVKKKSGGMAGGNSLLVFWTTGIGVVYTTLHLSGPVHNTSPTAPSSETATSGVPPARSFFSPEPPNVIPFPSSSTSRPAGAPATPREEESLLGFQQRTGGLYGSKGTEEGDEDDGLVLPASPGGPPPLSVVVTDFHILLLFDGKLTALSRITEEKVLEVPLSTLKYGTVRRLLQDPFDRSVWLYTDAFVCQVVVSKESAQAWRLYLDQEKFALAQAHCSTAAQREKVIVTQADWLLRRGRFVEAAELLAQAESVAFEEICLFFLSQRQEYALKTFFLCKYNQLANSFGSGGALPFGAGGAASSMGVDSDPDDQRNLGEISSSSAPSPQQVMLFLWIVEFCLHELAQIDAEMLQYSRGKYENNAGARGDPYKPGTGVPSNSLEQAGVPNDSGGGIRGTHSSTTESESRVRGEYHGSERAEGLTWLEKRKANAQAQLRKLLADFRNVNEVQPTIYSLLQSHGRFEELHHFAELCGDYESVVVHHMSRRNYFAVIQKLSSMTDIPLRDTLLYRLAPQLFRHEPVAFAAMLESQSFAHIDASRILPALLHCRGNLGLSRSREDSSDTTSSSNRQGSLTSYEERGRTRDEKKDPEERRSLDGGQEVVTNAGRQDAQHQHPEGRNRESAHPEQAERERREDESDASRKQNEEEERSSMVRRECGMELVEYFARQVTAMKGGGGVGGWTTAGGGAFSRGTSRHWGGRPANSEKEGQGGRWKGAPGLWNALIVFKAEAENEDELCRLLASQKAGQLPFDPQFALRFCLEKGRDRAVVLLYGLLGIHQEAVEKALSVNDMTLAQHAACAPADISQRQQLWLRLAHHAAIHEDVPALVALVQQSAGLLKIQDVLPYMSDSTVIDTLKDDICAALDAYEQRIAARYQEMDTHREAIAALKAELRAVNQRCVVVEIDQTCDVCCEAIFTERFYAFSCGHCFHATCCQRLRIPAMNVDLLAEFERRMVELDRAQEYGAPADVMQHLEKAVDDLLAGECLICGTLMIRAIALPFIGGPLESPEEVESWNILDDSSPSENDKSGS